MSKEYPIKSLTFYFPYGASASQCDKIAQLADEIIKQAGISEGGFTPTNKYGLNVENVTFADDAMMYSFGHCRHRWDDSGERCEMCGTKDWMT